MAWLIALLRSLLPRASWRAKALRFALTVKPIAGGSPEGDGGGDGDSGDGDGGDGAGKPDGDASDDDGAGKVTPDDDWQTKARKHEREAKRLRKQLEEREQALKQRDDAQKSEREKEIEQAREEARREALTEAEKERRSDRLEVAVTRLAARGITVGEGDGAKTLRFADPEDALVHIERAIRSGDADEDEIFDGDGKVQTEALTTALRELLDSKPHLKAGDSQGGNGGRPTGSADGGKGSGAAKGAEEMSADEHFAAIQRTKK